MDHAQPAAVLRPTTGSSESGTALILLMAVLMPVVLLVAAMTQTMIQRSSESIALIDAQKALLAAEAGIDEATYRGGIGTLVDGVSFDVDIDGDGSTSTGPMRCTVTPTWLRSDGVDNDGDGGPPDEADEDVYQVIAIGTYKGARRRLASYLGPVPLLPTITSAAVVSNPGVTISVTGSSQLSGIEMRLDGTPTGATQPGLAIAPPGTVAWLDSQLTGGERTRVVGAGGTPSLALTPAIDWATIVPQLQNIANVVLTSASYTGLNVGSTSPWTPQIALRNGNVTIQGTSTGVGILIVNGDLVMRGNFAWYGVVIVTGTVTCSSGSALIRGSVVQGSGGLSVTATGNLTIQYSGEAVALASSAAGRYTSFNGWQELSRQ